MRTRVSRALFAGANMALSCKRPRLFKVFPAEGRRTIRLSTVADADIYEKLGVWRREYDPQTGELVGFRLVGAEVNKVDGDLRSVQTSASITEGEMQMNVCRSRTFGLREEARLTRIKDGELPEDEVERCQAKIRVYPFVGAAKGAVLEAWPLGRGSAGGPC